MACQTCCVPTHPWNQPLTSCPFDHMMTGFNISQIVLNRWRTALPQLIFRYTAEETIAITSYHMCPPCFEEFIVHYIHTFKFISRITPHPKLDTLYNLTTLPFSKALTVEGDSIRIMGQRFLDWKQHTGTHKWPLFLVKENALFKEQLLQ